MWKGNDNDSITDRMLSLEEYINDLSEHSPLEIEQYKNNKLLSRFIERTLHLAIESFLDIGNHIISKNRLGEVNYNSDVVRLLAKNDIVKKNKQKYIQMVQFRNVLVHDYSDIDPEIIIDIVNNRLSDLKNLFRWYKEHLNI